MKINFVKLIYQAFYLFIMIFFIWLTFRFFNWSQIQDYLVHLLGSPFWLLMMFSFYWLAFLLKAIAWKLYVGKSIRLHIFLYGLYYSLFINHLLPIKVGDAIRTGVLMKEKQVDWDEAIHSVVVMRVLDLLVLGSIAALGSMIIGLAVAPAFILFLCGLGIIALLFILLNVKNIPFLTKHLIMVKKVFQGQKIVIILSLVFLSWIVEASVLFGVIKASMLDISILSAIWVNSVTIAGQVFHFTPGGIGNYETIMSFALITSGFDWQEAYSIAIVSHLFKFIFSYLVGIYVLIKLPIRWKLIRQWIVERRETT